MQTILGSNGVIGKNLALELKSYTNKIRLVGRNPKQINSDDELVVADLLNAEQTLKAVEGSEVVYLTVGLEYNIKIWQKNWPQLMHNVIEACKTHKARLVFFDNVYALGKVDGWMTEDSPLNPCSKKGEVRVQLNNMIMDEVRAGNLNAIIARAADFYGPQTPLSFVNIMVLENFKKGKAAQLILTDNKKHSLTYTPDAAKATAILGNSIDSFNQIWHLPTDKNVLTMKQFVEASAAAFGVKAKSTVLPRFMLRLVGLFVPAIKESMEMLYQNENDYLFDSSKFIKKFNFKPTTYSEGIKATVASMKL